MHRIQPRKKAKKERKKKENLEKVSDNNENIGSLNTEKTSTETIEIEKTDWNLITEEGNAETRDPTPDTVNRQKHFLKKQSIKVGSASSLALDTLSNSAQKRKTLPAMAKTNKRNKINPIPNLTKARNNPRDAEDDALTTHSLTKHDKRSYEEITAENKILKAEIQKLLKLMKENNENQKYIANIHTQNRFETLNITRIY